MKLLDYLPYFYTTSAETVELQESIEGENELLKNNIENLQKQLFVSTATWGLDYWEKYLGLTPSAEPIVKRRNRIIAKLRSGGTVTKEVILDIARAYASEVALTEYNELYTFFLEFFDLDEEKKWDFGKMNEAINEIKPAHLDHRIGINNRATLEVHTNLEEVKYKYIPCNCAYAGEKQANTYIRDKELVILPPSKGVV